MSAESPAAFTTDFPLRAADQCVKCGMCLPHCPTYGVTRDEAESPRGRIALMQGLATGLLPVTPAVEGHLDGCLTCRACESVCPAQVPYGRLIDAAREQLARDRPDRTRAARLMAAVLTRPWLRFLAALPLWLYRVLGLQGLVRRCGLLGRGRLARLESLLPEIHLPRMPASSATGAEAVALFANCTSPLAEPAVLDAAVELLEALGCRVEVPRDQACCGALYQRAGLPQPARACAQRNLATFGGDGPVLGVASGCTAQLLEYGALLESGEGTRFGQRVQDIGAFIAAHLRFAQLRFRPLPARVLLHTPCTLRHGVKAPDAARRLLGRIPELQVEMLDSACCGAAGSYFVTRPEMADALLEPKLERARAVAPKYLVSSNVGCAMHFAAGLRRARLSVEAVHPLALLARQRVAPPA